MQPRNEQMLNPEPCTASLEEAGTGSGLTRDPSPWGEAASVPAKTPGGASRHSAAPVFSFSGRTAWPRQGKRD